MRKYFFLILIFGSAVTGDIITNSVGGNLRWGLIAMSILLTVLSLPDIRATRQAALASVIFGIFYGLLCGVNIGQIIIVLAVTLAVCLILPMRNLISRNFVASLVLFNLWVLIFRWKGIFLEYRIVVENLVVGTIVAVIFTYIFTQITSRHALK